MTVPCATVEAEWRRLYRYFDPETWSLMPAPAEMTGSRSDCFPAIYRFAAVQNGH
jgi:hypothetical protein